MRNVPRTFLAMALWTGFQATTCDSNRSPTAPPPPAPGVQPPSVYYFGTIQVQSMGAPAAGLEVACVVQKVNAERGRNWTFELRIPEGPSAPTAGSAAWATDLLATFGFTEATYATGASNLELFGFSQGNANRFTEPCDSANTRVRMDLPVLIALPAPTAGVIQGNGTLKFDFTIDRWWIGGGGYSPGFYNDYSGHAEIAVQFHLRRQ